MVNVGAMMVGAAVYDPTLMQKVAHTLGWSVAFKQALTLRFPLFLTLIMAVGSLVVTLKMRETEGGTKAMGSRKKGTGQAIIGAFKLTLSAGRWILQTPFAWMIILTGLVFDHCIRMVITLGSQYYRLIQIPEASLGLLSALFWSMGLFVPKLAQKLAENHSSFFNLNVMAGLTLVGLLGLTCMWPYVGLVPMLLIGCAMFLCHYFISFYLNPITSSEQRATVLSFKGLFFNLGYGFIGVMYALLLASLRNHQLQTQPPLTGLSLENVVFVKSLTVFPLYFIMVWVGLLLYGRHKLKGPNPF
jgi:hypothetical protein